jgi:predicted ArsR family transcriptional regulator
MGRPGPNPSVSEAEIVRAIVAAKPPALGTSDLADEFDISTEAMRRRLHRLNENGILHKATVGGALVWWPTSEGKSLLAE